MGDILARIQGLIEQINELLAEAEHGGVALRIDVVERTNIKPTFLRLWSVIKRREGGDI